MPANAATKEKDPLKAINDPQGVAAPEGPKSPRRNSESPSLVQDAFSSLAQSGQEMTDRIGQNFKDYGIAGGLAGVGSEIVSGISQAGELANEKLVKPLATAAIGNKGVAAVTGQEPQMTPEERNALDNGIGDPNRFLAAGKTNQPSSTAPATIAQPVGTSAVIAPPAPRTEFQGTDTRVSDAFVNQGNANIRARRAEQGDAFQNSFNDENYQPARIADPSAGGVSKTPFQDQLQRQQLDKLIATATQPIDNSLPYDKKKTLIREQQAAQSTLGTLIGADTADKNRASDYESKKNADMLKSQKAAADAEKSANKEKRYFDPEQIDLLDDIPQQSKLRLGAIPQSQANSFLTKISKLSARELSEAIRTNAFDGALGLDTNTLVKAFNLDGKGGV